MRIRFDHGALVAVLLLATTACGSDDDARRAAADHDGGGGGTTAALPAPEGTTGSVTGMPANPGPGNSRIVPVEATPVEAAAVEAAPVDDARPGDAYIDIAAADTRDPLAPRPDGDDPMAAASPIIIVPEVPVRPVTTDDGTAVPRDARDATTTTQPPIGTEAATESTTLVIEPDDTGG